MVMWDSNVASVISSSSQLTCALTETWPHFTSCQILLQTAALSLWYTVTIWDSHASIISSKSSDCVRNCTHDLSGMRISFPQSPPFSLCTQLLCMATGRGRWTRAPSLCWWPLSSHLHYNAITAVAREIRTPYPIHLPAARRQGYPGTPAETITPRPSPT